jgi:hypothetical protein
MRSSFSFAGAFLILVICLPAAAQTPPAPPSDFDPKAKTPADVPKTLEIPKNMRIEVSVWRKKPIHYATPPDFNNLDFLVDPDLESATIERGDQDIHVSYNWQGNRSSEVYVINGLGYRKVNLAYPNLVVPSQSPINFWLNRQNLGGGKLEDFPGITWYSPSSFAGTASLNGGTVLVFAADAIKPGTTTYPEANSICLDPKTHLPLYMDDGVRILTFTYTSDSNVQMNPQGPYLDAIKKHLGHYP